MACLVLAAGAGLTWKWMDRQPAGTGPASAPAPAVGPGEAPVLPTEALKVAAHAPDQPASAESTASTTTPDAPAGPATSPAPGTKAPYQPGLSKYRNARDPAARAMLGRVGADVDADAYWISAVNDPSLPANERQDLIEDLNEDGLSDPHHPRTADLPLIRGRLALLEKMAPAAMDRVNADAIREAQKDLTAMVRKLEER